MRISKIVCVALFSSTLLFGAGESSEYAKDGTVTAGLNKEQVKKLFENGEYDTLKGKATEQSDKQKFNFMDFMTQNSFSYDENNDGFKIPGYDSKNKKFDGESAKNIPSGFSQKATGFIDNYQDILSSAQKSSQTALDEYNKVKNEYEKPIKELSDIIKQMDDPATGTSEKDINKVNEVLSKLNLNIKFAHGEYNGKDKAFDPKADQYKALVNRQSLEQVLSVIKQALSKDQAYISKIEPAKQNAQRQAIILEFLKQAKEALDTMLDPMIQKENKDIKSNFENKLKDFDDKTKEVGKKTQDLLKSDLGVKISAGDVKDVPAVEAKTHILGEVKDKLENQADTDENKKSSIKEAIKAGVKVEHNGKNISESDVDNISSSDIDSVLQLAKTNTQTAIEKLEKVKNALEQKARTEQELKNAGKILKSLVDKKVDKLKAVSGLNASTATVLNALTNSIITDSVARKIISDLNDNETVQTINDIVDSLDEAQSSMSEFVTSDVVRFNTGLATNTRLAKLSNPFNDNLALAYAISKLDGERFADSGNALSDIVRAYTDRFMNDNNLWGNIIGGRNNVSKGGANTKYYGFTLGYDRAFDNSIFGGFFAYVNAESKNSVIKNESDNYQLGIYSRSYFGNSELDLMASIGRGKHDIQRSVNNNAFIGTANGDYKSDFYDLKVEYGYIFDLDMSKTFFAKPIVGIEYFGLKNKAFSESGSGINFNYDATKNRVLSANLGVEFRKYTDSGNFIYVTPGIERELHKSASSGSVNIVNIRNSDISVDVNKKKNTYATLKAGAEFKITQALSTNINFGTKLGSDNKLYTGTIGVSYKF